MTHKPVLLREVLEVFAPLKIRTFFDGTLGAGGHAKAILEAHPEIERYIGVDRDSRSHDLARKNLAPFEKKLDLIYSSFAEATEALEEPIDGFLVDVGVSSMQFDEPERGFSFKGDAPLDMRMDPDQALTAEVIVNRFSEKELADLIFEYGEERRARKVAKAIVEARKKKRIQSTKELAQIVTPVATKGKLHPATLVFQALRIAVNDELFQLEKGLKEGIDKLSPGGRLVAISFHSLEDRIVKNVLRDGKQDLLILTKKPISPTKEEIRENARARSAKLRAAEKKSTTPP